MEGRGQILKIDYSKRQLAVTFLDQQTLSLEIFGFAELLQNLESTSIFFSQLDIGFVDPSPEMDWCSLA